MTKLESELDDRIEITKRFDDTDSANITQIIRNQLVIMESLKELLQRSETANKRIDRLGSCSYEIPN